MFSALSKIFGGGSAAEASTASTSASRGGPAGGGRVRDLKMTIIDGKVGSSFVSKLMPSSGLTTLGLDFSKHHVKGQTVDIWHTAGQARLTRFDGMELDRMIEGGGVIVHYDGTSLARSGMRAAISSALPAVVVIPDGQRIRERDRGLFQTLQDMGAKVMYTAELALGIGPLLEAIVEQHGIAPEDRRAHAAEAEAARTAERERAAREAAEAAEAAERERVAREAAEAAERERAAEAERERAAGEEAEAAARDAEGAAVLAMLAASAAGDSAVATEAAAVARSYQTAGVMRGSLNSSSASSADDDRETMPVA